MTLIQGVLGYRGFLGEEENRVMRNPHCSRNDLVVKCLKWGEQFFKVHFLGIFKGGVEFLILFVLMDAIFYKSHYLVTLLGKILIFWFFILRLL